MRMHVNSEHRTCTTTSRIKYCWPLFFFFNRHTEIVLQLGLYMYICSLRTESKGTKTSIYECSAVSAFISNRESILKNRESILLEPIEKKTKSNSTRRKRVIVGSALRVSNILIEYPQLVRCQMDSNKNGSPFFVLSFVPSRHRISIGVPLSKCAAWQILCVPKHLIHSEWLD